MTPPCMDIAMVKLNIALKECARHTAILQRASTKLHPLFPLDAKRLETLNDDDLAHLDQFVYRITRLQDTMGTRLFPHLAFFLSGSDEPRPFLDLLHQLEKFGILPSAAVWQNLRNLRNSLTHDYPDTPEQTIAALNLLHRDWKKLVNIYQNIHNFVQTRNIQDAS